MKPVFLASIVFVTSASVAVAKPAATPQSVAKPQKIGGLYYMPSGSMEPTLPLGARIWASNEAYQKAQPKRGDIVLLDLPLSLVSLGTGSGTTIFVKRIVAVPGDRVEMKNGVLWLNGQAQKEPHVLWRDESPFLPANDRRYSMKVVRGVVYSRDYNSSGQPDVWTRNSVIVPMPEQAIISGAKTEALPPHKFLVLGDHRSNSNDSHVFGLVDRSQIKAKVTMRIYPFPRTF